MVFNATYKQTNTHTHTHTHTNKYASSQAKASPIVCFDFLKEGAHGIASRVWSIKSSSSKYYKDITLSSILKVTLHARNAARLHFSLPKDTDFDYPRPNTPYRESAGAGGNLELRQDPDIVDEPHRHVHEFLVIHGATGNGEDVVGIQTRLHLVRREG